MTSPLLLKEKEETLLSPETPHLSHSRINRYLLCPEQYRLYYIENHSRPTGLGYPGRTVPGGQGKTGRSGT